MSFAPDMDDDDGASKDWLAFLRQAEPLDAKKLPALGFAGTGSAQFCAKSDSLDQKKASASKMQPSASAELRDDSKVWEATGGGQPFSPLKAAGGLTRTALLTEGLEDPGLELARAMARQRLQADNAAASAQETQVAISTTHLESAAAELKKLVSDLYDGESAKSAAKPLAAEGRASHEEAWVTMHAMVKRLAEEKVEAKTPPAASTSPSLQLSGSAQQPRPQVAGAEATASEMLAAAAASEMLAAAAAAESKKLAAAAAAARQACHADVRKMASRVALTLEKMKNDFDAFNENNKGAFDDVMAAIADITRRFTVWRRGANM